MGITIELKYPNCRNCGITFALPAHLCDERWTTDRPIFCPGCGRNCKTVEEDRVERIKRDLLYVASSRDSALERERKLKLSISSLKGRVTFLLADNDRLRENLRTSK